MKSFHYRNNSYYIIQILIFFFIFNAIQLFPEIKRKYYDDGLVEFHNRGFNKKPSGVKFNFKSEHNPLIEKISNEHGLDPYLIKCIIKVESNFNSDAVSVAGAMGLMQIMQQIARYYNVKDPFNPEENLRAGIKHFSSLMKFFKNDVPLALAAYHAGLGRVKRNMSVPPIKSTIDYVKKVMSYYSQGGENYDIEKRVRRLYQKIKKDGTLDIYN